MKSAYSIYIPISLLGLYFWFEQAIIYRLSNPFVSYLNIDIFYILILQNLVFISQLGMSSPMLIWFTLEDTFCDAFILSVNELHHVCFMLKRNRRFTSNRISACFSSRRLTFVFAHCFVSLFPLSFCICALLLTIIDHFRETVVVFPLHFCHKTKVKFGNSDKT